MRYSKDAIDKLIGIWISGVTSVSHDAGWEGDSMLSRMITYQGQPPEPTRNDQSNAAMMRALRLIRGNHHDFPAINAVVLEIFAGDEAEKIVALLARHYYVHLNPYTGRVWTNSDRCFLIGQTLSQYKRNVERSYPLVAAELSKYYRYRKAG